MTVDVESGSWATPPGSSFWFGQLFAPEDRRAGVGLLFAFHGEIQDSVRRPRDPTVARTRLAWWQDEIGRLDAGQPRHPVTRALKPVMEAADIEPTCLGRIVHAGAQELAAQTFADMPALKKYCDNSLGALIEVIARLMGYQNQDNEIDVRASARCIGTALRMIQILRDAGQDISTERSFLPGPLIGVTGPSHENRAGGGSAPSLQPALSALGNEAADHLERGRLNLPATERSHQPTVVVLAALYQRLLEKFNRHDFVAEKDRIKLHPLEKLWVSWRAARRAAKGKFD